MSPVNLIKAEPVSTPTSSKFQSSGDLQSEDVVRVDVPIPFFMKNDVFSDFKKPDYSWNINREGEPINPTSLMVLLVETEEKNKHLSITVDESRAFPEKKIKVEYSIGGCPLECPFDLNEDFEEALAIDNFPLIFDGICIPKKYNPLSVDDGKKAIGKVRLQAETFVRELNLVNDSEGWFDSETPVLAFVSGYDQNSSLLFTGFRRKAKSINVHLVGKFPPNPTILNLELFRKYHEKNVYIENIPTTTMAHVMYEKIHGEHPSKGKVYLEFVFKEPKNLFDLPPRDSLSKIAIQPLPGDANPHLEALWSEIEDLEKWMNVLMELNSEGSSKYRVNAASFMNSTLYEIDETKLTPCAKAVKELLNQDPSADFDLSSDINTGSDSLHHVLANVLVHKRIYCDFTDRLWSVVRTCENTDELQDCLVLVFQAVSKKLYIPYLLPENVTELAKDLTLVTKGEMKKLLEIRSHEVLLKLVIECGLMKLFKDYKYTLEVCYFIEQERFRNFTPITSDFDESLSRIKKLHCTLEVLCLSKERLNVSANILNGHVRKMLSTLSNSGTINWDDIYHFDVPSHELFQCAALKSLRPIYYKVKMDSHAFLKWATTTVVISLENYICYKKKLGNDDLETSLRHYYMYVMTENGPVEKSS